MTISSSNNLDEPWLRVVEGEGPVSTWHIGLVHEVGTGEVTPAASCTPTCRPIHRLAAAVIVHYLCTVLVQDLCLPVIVLYAQ